MAEASESSPLLTKPSTAEAAAAANSSNQQTTASLALLHQNNHQTHHHSRNNSYSNETPGGAVTSSSASSAINSNSNNISNTGNPADNSSNNNNNSIPNAEDELPTNVCTWEQLESLPPECRSSDPTCPLRHIDEHGNEYHYHLSPMQYSVLGILLVELLERFCFYGVNCTQTSYLTGVYNEFWNADMPAVDASTYVSVSVAVAYTTPFVGALLADAMLGEYWSLVVGATAFYLPGLLVIALTTVPHFMGADEFNHTALAVGLLFLWPVGTGIVKSVVNVFGAKQFHPILQSSLIEAYYVKFYMCINIGALVGGVVVPLLAQTNVTYAYCIPVAMLTIGVAIFLGGSRRYVIEKPKGKTELPCCMKTNKTQHKSSKYVFDDQSTPETIPLTVILRICLLIIPFNIAYSQMSTTFIIQGTVMRKFLWVDAACMNNADAISVLFFGHVIGSGLYPALAKRNIKLATTYKFAIGSSLGALAVAWALLVEYKIWQQYTLDGQRISILWQTMSYVLIGIGEIFAVSAAYEVAFTASPPEQKVLASAVNLFCIGGLPNLVCIGLYHACQPWFLNSRGTSNLTHLEDYASARTYYYFGLLMLITLCGVAINLVPQVRDFVESVEDKATELTKTPKTPKLVQRRIQQRRRDKLLEEDSDDSDDPEAAAAMLRRAKRHRDYLKYGSGPSLIKLGSMRAGPSLSTNNGQEGRVMSASTRPSSTKHRNARRADVQRLYRSTPDVVLTPTNTSHHGPNNNNSNNSNPSTATRRILLPPQQQDSSASTAGSHSRVLARSNSG